MMNYNELRDGQEFYANGYKKGYEDAKKEYARPKGEWIHLGGDDWCCSECDRVIRNEGWENPSDIGDCYCPTCGADMRKGKKNDLFL